MSEFKSPEPFQNESLGVTDDFFWYELSIMRNAANQLAGRMENMERVLKARSKEVARYNHFLEDQVRDLKREVAALKEQAMKEQSHE